MIEALTYAPAVSLAAVEGPALTSSVTMSDFSDPDFYRDWGFWFFFTQAFAVALTAFIPPFPSEVMVIASGAMAADGIAPLSLVLAVTILGCWVGDVGLYLLFRYQFIRVLYRWKWGRKVHRGLLRANIRAGGASTFVGLSLMRFIPGGRSASMATAGMMRLGWPMLLPLSGLGAITWSLWIVGLGYITGTTTDLPPWANTLVGIGVGTLVGLIIAASVSRHRRRARQRDGPSVNGGPASTDPQRGEHDLAEKSPDLASSEASPDSEQDYPQGSDEPTPIPSGDADSSPFADESAEFFELPLTDSRAEDADVDADADADAESDVTAAGKHTTDNRSTQNGEADNPAEDSAGRESVETDGTPTTSAAQDDEADSGSSEGDPEGAEPEAGNAENVSPEGTKPEGSEAESIEATEDHPAEPSQPVPAAGHTGEIRLSQPTPTVPPEQLEPQQEKGLSGFFDNLDEKISGMTGKITSAFRRRPPEAAAEEQAEPVEEVHAHSNHLDAVELQGNDAGTETPGESPEPDQSAEVEAEQHETSERPQPAGNGYDQDNQDVTQVIPRFVDDEAPSETAPETEPAQAEAPPASASAQQPSFPAPKSDRDRREYAEQRRRELIMEKASAIEAATTAPEPDLDYESADEEEDLYTYIPPYNLPSRDPDPEPQRHDLIRQIYVSVGAAAALFSMLWMFGFPSGPVILGGSGLDTLVDGWYSGEEALLSPSDTFYWLWPVIVAGLLAHAVFQWTTTQISTPRQRRSGWLVGTASILMLIWTASVHAGWLTLAVLASLAAALALIDAIRQFTFHTARNSMERRFTDATVGLFAGWALVGAMSSISVWLTAYAIRIPGIPALLWALIALLLTIWVAAFYSMTERGRTTIALGMGWGLFWLIFPRLLSDVTSVGVAIGAGMGAFIVILATESRRHRINHAERRAAMGRPVEDII